MRDVISHDQGTYNPLPLPFRLPFTLYDLSPRAIMTSILVSATQAAHSAAASLLSKAQIAPGGTIPSGIKVKENQVRQTSSFSRKTLIRFDGGHQVETPFELQLTGKVCLCIPSVPSRPHHRTRTSSSASLLHSVALARTKLRAMCRSCPSSGPRVSRTSTSSPSTTLSSLSPLHSPTLRLSVVSYISRAWKEKLSGEGVHFIADDTGAFTSGIGMMFDATPLLGAPRSKVRAGSHRVKFIC
jgi:hypothetical protein